MDRQVNTLCVLILNANSLYIIKAEQNLFNYRLVPKMKLTLPIVQNICRIGQFEIGGSRPSLIDRCQILSPIQQSSM